MEKDITIYRCDCSSEGIVVEFDDEFEQYYLSIWTQCSRFNNGTLSIVDRISLIWQILKTGTIWTDNIILNKETAEKLSKKLIQHTNKKNLIKG